MTTIHLPPATYSNAESAAPEGFDAIFATPYPFSDHPSFPEGILKRALEDAGFSVGIIETPFWQRSDSFKILGKPRLFFAVISGPVDSVVLNYTSSRKRRMEDLYQLNGNAFFEGYPPSISYKIRPDRAVIVFSQRIRQAWGDIPVIIGGIESSLRLFAHYDFQQDAIRRSILLDSRADLLVTGPGEKQLVTAARLLKGGALIREITIPGTARTCKETERPDDAAELPSYEEITTNPARLIEAHKTTLKAMGQGKALIQKYGNRIVASQPPERYSTGDLDHIYGLSYMRSNVMGGDMSPALRMNLFSVTSHRGCAGGCAFCSLNLQEGRRIISRSLDSVVLEIERLTHHKEWKGYISDIGGPSADMYGAECEGETCIRLSCLSPSRCPRFDLQRRYLGLLRECRSIKGVKKIFVGSGIRYDLLLHDPELLEEIMVHHCGSFLRIAPEHTEDHILRLMGKPPYKALEDFVRLFRSIRKAMKRKVELAPYLMVGHPGETERDVEEMKRKLFSLSLPTKDVQIFTPTPGTLSTAMYVAATDLTGRDIHVEKGLKALSIRRRMIASG